MDDRNRASGNSTSSDSPGLMADRDDRTPTIPDTTPDPKPKPKPNPGPSVEVARPVPGKPGFVFSPYNNKIIDVKGIPSGTLVQDPNFPATEKKHFRVP